MKGSILFLILLLAGFSSCKKNDAPAVVCNINQTKALNVGKVTVNNGIWGTVSSQEGNCMPVQGPSTTCTECPVKRTVRIYEYTLANQATPDGTSPVFFTAFSTQLVAEVESDETGFYETNLAPGQYTIVVVENGKLYAPGRDAQGGLNSFNHPGNQSTVNFKMTYKAVF